MRLRSVCAESIFHYLVLETVSMGGKLEIVKQESEISISTSAFS